MAHDNRFVQRLTVLRLRRPASGSARPDNAELLVVTNDGSTADSASPTRYPDLAAHPLFSRGHRHARGTPAPR